MLELNNLSVTGFEPSRLRTKLSHEKSKLLISYSSYQTAFWNGMVDFQVLALPDRDAAGHQSAGPLLPEPSHVATACHRRNSG